MIQLPCARRFFQRSFIACQFQSTSSEVFYKTVIGDVRCHFIRIETFNFPLLDFIQLFQMMKLIVKCGFRPEQNLG